jgi:uncharacterized protein (TIGR00251 family)
MGSIQATADGVVLAVRLTPRASRNEVQGLAEDGLRIRLQAPPVDGKANEALRRFLADELDVAPSQVVLLSGESSRHKRVLVRGLAEPQARRALGV